MYHGEGVTWDGWKRIEAYEGLNGLRCEEQPREKVTDVGMLEEIAKG